MQLKLRVLQLVRVLGGELVNEADGGDAGAGAVGASVGNFGASAGVAGGASAGVGANSNLAREFGSAGVGAEVGVGVGAAGVSAEVGVGVGAAGVAKNCAVVESVSGVSAKPEKVGRGEFCFCQNFAQMRSALAAGAFGVVFEPRVFDEIIAAIAEKSAQKSAENRAQIAPKTAENPAPAPSLRASTKCEAWQSTEKTTQNETGATPSNSNLGQNLIKNGAQNLNLFEIFADENLAPTAPKTAENPRDCYDFAGAKSRNDETGANETAAEKTGATPSNSNLAQNQNENLAKIPPAQATPATPAQTPATPAQIFAATPAQIFAATIAFEPLFAEIALICVPSLPAAQLRFTRFLLAHLGVRLVGASDLVGEIAGLFALPKNIAVLSGELAADLARLEAAPAAVIIGESLAARLGLNLADFAPRDIIAPLPGCASDWGSFFFTTLEVDGAAFDALPFARVFADELGGVVAFLQGAGTEVRWRDLRALRHFDALFLGEGGRVVEVGQSGRAVICEPDAALWERERAWLAARTGSGVVFLRGDGALDALDALRRGHFRYALINAPREAVLAVLEKREDETSLF